MKRLRGSGPVASDLIRKHQPVPPAPANRSRQGTPMLSVTCSSCRKKLSLKDTLAGKKIKCPGCGQVVAVPDKVAAGPSNADERTLPPEPAPPSARPDRSR